MFYRQPAYFRDFRCIGGTCQNSCCIGWVIDWRAEEIDKVKNAPGCSEELRALCESKFEPNGDKYMVKLNEDGRCPFLTEDNFCRIQRELGAECLSDTCSIYPRHYIVTDNAAYRYCNMSCPEVIKKLLNDPKSMDLVNFPIKGMVTIKGALKNTPENLAQNPALKFREELLEFFYEIIADKKHGVETSIILGALAAQKLSQVAEKGADGIPAAILAIRPQLHNGAQLKQIEAIKPNYNVKLGFAAEMMRQILHSNSVGSLADSTGRLNIDLYRAGEQRLVREFADRDFFMRNICLNLLLEFALPFKFSDRTIFENYSMFAAAFAMMKLDMISTAEGAERLSNSRFQSTGDIKLHFSVKVDTESFVRGAAATISRALCHNNDNAQMLLKGLAAYKMTTPAYIALLIK